MAARLGEGRFVEEMKLRTGLKQGQTDGVRKDEIRNGAPDLIRIAASPIVLEEYLPDIFHTLEARFPRLNFAVQAREISLFRPRTKFVCN